jgi:hypothetical protein
VRHNTYFNLNIYLFGTQYKKKIKIVNKKEIFSSFFKRNPVFIISIFSSSDISPKSLKLSLFWDENSFCLLSHDVAGIVEDIACNDKPCLIFGCVALASDAVCSYCLGTDPIWAGNVGVNIFCCCLHLACKDRLRALFGCEN